MNTKDFKVVLWDVSENNIDELPLEFVIQRVLSYGALALIIESIKKNGIDMVKKVFLEMKPSAISAKKYEYLKKYLLV